MKKRLVAACSLLIIVLNTIPGSAHGPFAKALKAKHDLGRVSCYTCHLRKSEVPDENLAAFKENSKQFRRDIGEQFSKLLKGKGITAKLIEVKPLEFDDPKKIKAQKEAAKEFLKVLSAVEALKMPSGPLKGKTYGELLRSATLPDVKPKE
ncbi:MAG: hypothetical protein IH991_18660 [Planctomycetes bacterium]|nr:hypothetical protein [Planctomycetota bacterium]